MVKRWRMWHQITYREALRESENGEDNELHTQKQMGVMQERRDVKDSVEFISIGAVKEVRKWKK